MKTSTYYKWLIFIPFTFFLLRCASSDDGDDIRSSYLKAAIHNECLIEFNYTGTNLYTILREEEYVGDVITLGAHPTDTTQLPNNKIVPDIGIEIVYTTSFAGIYPVSDTHENGKAFIFYIDENGNEYYSSYNNYDRNVQVVLVSTDDTGGNYYRVSFNNVEVYCANIDDTKCIGSFQYYDYNISPYDNN